MNVPRAHMSVGFRIVIASIISLVLVIFVSVIPISHASHHIPVLEGKAVLPQFDSTITHYSLDGDWLLTKERGEPEFQKVPAVAWGNGYGVYSLSLAVPSSEEGIPLQLFTRNMGTSGIVSVNGEYIGEQGVYGESPALAEASALTSAYTFTPHSGDNLIEISVSNFTHPRGGLWEQVLIARAPVLQNLYDRQVSLDSFLFGIIVFISIYICALSIQLREYSLLYFALAIFFVALGNSTRYTFSIYRIFPWIDYVLVKKSALSFFYLGGGFIAKSFAADLLRKRKSLLINIIFVISVCAGLLILLLPYRTGYTVSIFFYPFLFFVFSIFIIHQYQSIFTYFTLKSLLWAVPRLIIQMLLLYGTAHDSYSFVTGRYDVDMLPYMSTLYAIVYSLLLVQTILDNRQRLEVAKSQIITIADKTRESLRNALHDRLGQMTHGLEFLSESLIRSGRVDQERLKMINETAKDINSELRSLLGELSPSRLEDLGFKKAVEDMVKMETKIYGIPIVLFLDDVDFAIWSLAAEHLYLVIRESLTNAVHHASPTRIEVTLRFENERYILDVVNDGLEKVRFIPKVVKGHGIDIMRYRIEALGGSMFVHAEGKGLFRVHVEIPQEEI